MVIIWAQTFGLLYGNEYKQEFLAECKRVLRKDGLFSFSGHDLHFLQAYYPDCLNGRKFYPYANTEMYWETFEAADLTRFAEQAGLEVVLCEKGKIYKPEDGTILHCLCKKQ